MAKRAIGDDAENTSARCRDNRDNDGDGRIDCDDRDCGEFAVCVEAGGDADSDGDGEEDVDGNGDGDTGAAAECVPCIGATEYCDAGACIDDCAGLECGLSPIAELDCGSCQGDRPICRENRCEVSPIEMVLIPGGRFDMGSNMGEPNEIPVHTVTVSDFEMAETEVTLAQYEMCVDQGGCTASGVQEDACSWGMADWGDRPINCLGWMQASEFCAWAGMRLPSEAEWEYAARNGGETVIYPWGDEPATCDVAVMASADDVPVPGCGAGTILPVCSIPEGNTAHGLCDMAGNVHEWVQDNYVDSYKNTPVDGTAFEDPTIEERVFRGGSYVYADPLLLRTTSRKFAELSGFVNLGFRCARRVETPRPRPE